MTLFVKVQQKESSISGEEYTIYLLDMNNELKIWNNCYLFMASMCGI